jgi:hypothetical protein
MFSLTARGKFCLAITSHSVGIVTINVSMLRRTCPLVKDAPNYPSSQTVPIQTNKRVSKKHPFRKDYPMVHNNKGKKSLSYAKLIWFYKQQYYSIWQNKYSCIQNCRVQGKTRIEGTVWPDLKGKGIKSGAGSS